MKKYLALGSALALGACNPLNLTPQQQQNLMLYSQLAKQIGTDAVQIWCASSGIIYVIANDINAKARVTVNLGKNAAAAKDACPMIQSGTVAVATAANVTAGTVTTAATPVSGS